MADEPNLSEEVKKMQSEPLLPVELQLIGWSLALGVALLGLLLWLGSRFFPV